MILSPYPMEIIFLEEMRKRSRIHLLPSLASVWTMTGGMVRRPFFPLVDAPVSPYGQELRDLYLSLLPLW